MKFFPPISVRLIHGTMALLRDFTLMHQGFIAAAQATVINIIHLPNLICMLVNSVIIGQ